MAPSPKELRKQGSLSGVDKYLKKIIFQNILGFRVAGVKLRDKEGNIILDNFGSKASFIYNTKEKITDLIKSILKSNESDMNFDALKELMYLLNKIAKFIENSKRLKHL